MELKAVLEGVKQPGLVHVLLPQVAHGADPRAAGARRGRPRQARSLLAVVGLIFWAAVFGVLFRVLRYFKGTEEIGALLAGKLLGIALLSFASVLLLSNVITALSSYFLAKDLDLLVSSPVDRLRLYLAKLGRDGRRLLVDGRADGGADLRGVRRSSTTAAGSSPLVRGGGRSCPRSLLPGGDRRRRSTTILVNVFPARRTRDLLSIIALGAAAGVILLFRIIRPEQLARPEGFRNLLDFITVLRDADLAVPAERVGVEGGDELPHRHARLAVGAPRLEQRRGVRGGRRRGSTGGSSTVGYTRAQEGAERFVRGGFWNWSLGWAARRASGRRGASSCSRTCGSSSATPRSGAS